MRKLLLIGILALCLAVSMAAAAIVYELTIPGNVKVKETQSGTAKVEAFEDAACTRPLAYIDWGELSPGETKQFNFYLKNTGSVSISNVLVQVVSDVCSCGGSYQGGLEAGQSKQYSATLCIAPTATAGNYSVQLEIQCTA
jgi:uncharacterized membrane protein